MSTLSSSTSYYPAKPGLGAWLLIGFIAGALAVLIFHQGAVALMNAAQWTERAPYGMQATQPFGIPQVWSLTFWGGVWGVVFAALLRRLEGALLVAASVLLGAVLPTLVAWFIVAPLKGQPAAGGFAPNAMAFGLIVNAAWGLGTGLGLVLLGRKRSSERRRATEDRRKERRRAAMGRRSLDRASMAG